MEGPLLASHVMQLAKNDASFRIGLGPDKLDIYKLDEFEQQRLKILEYNTGDETYYKVFCGWVAHLVGIERSDIARLNIIPNSPYVGIKTKNNPIQKTN